LERLLADIETGTQFDPPRRNPLKESLGDVRILRTSPLVAVPPAC
jgi:hypothetical protein